MAPRVNIISDFGSIQNSGGYEPE